MCASKTVGIQNDVMDLDSLNGQPKASTVSSSLAEPGAAAGEVISGVKDLLASIRDMMKECVRTMSQQRHEEEKKEKMMSDWKVAAAVIDRICFVLITLFFIGGTLALVVLRFLPHDLHLPNAEW